MATPPPLPHSLFDDDETVLIPTAKTRKQWRENIIVTPPSASAGPSMAILELERVRSELQQAQRAAETSHHHQQTASVAQAQLAQLQQQVRTLGERLHNKDVELRQILERIAESRAAERDLNAKLEQAQEHLEHSQSINRKLASSRTRLRERAQKLDRSLRRLAREAHQRFAALRSEHSAHAQTQLELGEARQGLQQTRAALSACQAELREARQGALETSMESCVQLRDRPTLPS